MSNQKANAAAQNRTDAAAVAATMLLDAVHAMDAAVYSMEDYDAAATALGYRSVLRFAAHTFRVLQSLLANLHSMDGKPADVVGNYGRLLAENMAHAEHYAAWIAAPRKCYQFQPLHVDAVEKAAAAVTYARAIMPNTSRRRRAAAIQEIDASRADAAAVAGSTRRGGTVSRAAVEREIKEYTRHGADAVHAADVADAIAARREYAHVKQDAVYARVAAYFDAAGYTDTLPLTRRRIAAAARRMEESSAEYAADVYAVLMKDMRPNMMYIDADAWSAGVVTWLESWTRYVELIRGICEKADAAAVDDALTLAELTAIHNERRRECAAVAAAIIKYAALKYKRKDARGRGASLSLDAASSEETTLLHTLADDAAAASFAAVETRDAAAHFMGMLSDRQGKLVQLFAAGYTTPHAADVLGVHRATAARERIAIIDAARRAGIAAV